jgi:hypothetical protein
LAHGVSEKRYLTRWPQRRSTQAWDANISTAAIDEVGCLRCRFQNYVSVKRSPWQPHKEAREASKLWMFLQRIPTNSAYVYLAGRIAVSSIGLPRKSTSRIMRQC